MTSKLDLETKYFIDIFVNQNTQVMPLILSAFPQADLQSVIEIVRLRLTQLSYIELVDFCCENQIHSLNLETILLSSRGDNYTDYNISNVDIYENSNTYLRSAKVQFVSETALKKFYVKFNIHKITRGYCSQGSIARLDSTQPLLPAVDLIAAVFGSLIRNKYIKLQSTVARNYSLREDYILKFGFITSVMSSKVVEIKEVIQKHSWFDEEVYLFICDQTANKI
jgi:hypothetical protein